MSIPFGTANRKPIVISATGAEQALAGVELYDDVLQQSISSSVDCVVDSGSHYTILPDSVLQSAGLHAGSFVPIRTISGATSHLPAYQVHLLIEGAYVVSATVLSSSAAGFTPVLGIREAKDAFDFGFDFSHWYFD